MARCRCKDKVRGQAAAGWKSLKEMSFLPRSALDFAPPGIARGMCTFMVTHRARLQLSCHVAWGLLGRLPVSQKPEVLGVGTSEAEGPNRNCVPLLTDGDGGRVATHALSWRHGMEARPTGWPETFPVCPPAMGPPTYPPGLCPLSCS